MIALRELQEKDAELMLEWMHDSDIQKGFKKKMTEMSLEDAKEFIKSAKIPKRIVNGDNIHYGIVNTSDDIYLGTISLKDIDLENRNAEYAITLRKCAQGKGIASIATGLILKKAFFELDLGRVFLSVYADNISAIRLYERSGFTLEGEFRNHFRINGRGINWKWYGMLKEEYDENIFRINADII